MTRIELSVAALGFALYALFFLILFVLVLRQAARRRKLDGVTEAALPAIREALVDYLAGSNDQTRIREFLNSDRRALSAAILTFHGTVAGSARDRLCDLALELALVHDWCEDARSKDLAVRRAAYERLSFVCSYEPCRRVGGDVMLQALNDRDSEVRLPAARALVQSGTTEEIGRIFDLAVSENPLIRILLTEDLRRHAVMLCETVVPRILTSAPPSGVLATLQILAAWERAISIAGLNKLIDHPDRDIRVAALRLAPLTPNTVETRRDILRELTNSDSDISIVAALSAGRMRLQEALPSLSRCVRTGSAELARSAASAMAEMPPRGWQTLEELAASSSQAYSFIAAEALQNARRKAGV